jgi:hypothetical protein
LIVLPYHSPTPIDAARYGREPNGARMDSLPRESAPDLLRRQAGAIRHPFERDLNRGPVVSAVASPTLGSLTAWPAWVWGVLATCTATIPFLPGLSGTRVFYVRDLTIAFWGRYLWLRRELLSGTFPLWDPYTGGGQSAVADALHQLFLLPALAVRLIGSEVIGFNLWIATPFPLAALGAWLFFRRRFASDASALGAIVFAVSGPIVSTGNFPNLAWAAAAIPWMLWAVDRVAATDAPRDIAVLAVVTACQAFAGDPATLLATLIIAIAFAAIVSEPFPSRTRLLASVAGGLALGLVVAAIQLMPAAGAAVLSERAAPVAQGLWSVHPLALVEMISLHLFGDFFASQSLAAVPWLPALNAGREPFFFSIYFGLPVLSLAVFGLAASGCSRWTPFWTTAGVISLLSAFGDYTPFYPFVRDHLPLLPVLRSPAKYMVMWSMVVATATATGWDSMARSSRDRRFTNARRLAILSPLTIGALGWMVAGACMYLPNVTAVQFYELARSLHIPDPLAAASYMLRTLPQAASSVLLLSGGTAVLVFAGTQGQKQARLARTALFTLIVVDLVGQAWGINPTIHRDYLAEPEWLRLTHLQPDARFYVGGKNGGTLDASDLDASVSYLNPPGLSGSMSRAAISSQANFDPSGWRSREMLSYDIAAVWPREFAVAAKRFSGSGRFERDLFLDRTGVRYRVLPQREAAGRLPLIRVPLVLESFLFDYGGGVAPRAMVVSETRVARNLDEQVEMLFTGGWDIRSTAILAHEPVASGDDLAAVPLSATITSNTANRVVVVAGLGRAGGYLVLLDSFSAGWHATADGEPAAIVRANGLFRAVRLNPGRHTVAFVYRPRAFLLGAAASAAALVLVTGCLVWPARTKRRDEGEQ